MQVEDVNRLLAQFKQMQKMVKQIGGNKGPKMSKKMRRIDVYKRQIVYIDKF